MRGLEDRLSDTLHQKLMARFVDRRTSVLMRQLGDRETMLAGVAEDGAVTVEGHYVGRLKGVVFVQPRAATSLEEKALRGAAQKAVAPEIAKRLGALAAEPDEAFSLTPDGAILWRGAISGQLAGGGKVRLLGDLGPPPARERAQRRLEAFLADERTRRLNPLTRLEAAMAKGELRGLARGLAHRLLENGGVLPRRTIETEMKSLSQTERRALRALGVNIGAFSLHLPGLLTPDALAFAQALAPDPAAPSVGVLTRLKPGPVDAMVLAARGLMAVGGLAAPVDQLEQLDGLMRAAPREALGVVVGEQILEALGWSAREAADILRGLGYAPTNRSEPIVWRRRGQVERREPPRVSPRPGSPFAALAQFKVAGPAKPQGRPKVRPQGKPASPALVKADAKPVEIAAAKPARRPRRRRRATPA
jgi:ATP-dependent RNA helicase SUPV3L1/SUV3